MSNTRTDSFALRLGTWLLGLGLTSWTLGASSLEAQDVEALDPEWRAAQIKDALRAAATAEALKAIPEPADSDGADSAARPAQEGGVETKGVSTAILHEAPIDGGHLPELAGEYKLRVTEITIRPNGYVGDHNHVGPGIREVTAGEMEYILPDRTVTYRTGDFFFESGDVSHRVLNETDVVSKHILFEILPASHEGPSLIPPR